MTSAADDLTTATRRARLRLLPFAALVLVYVSLYNPLLRLPPENLVAASFKAAPIWYLAHYVGMARDFQSNGVAIGARVGLVLSSLGDVCLIWRRKLFLPGILCFALAQIGYIAGLRSWLKTYYQWEEKRRDFLLVGAFALLFLLTFMNSWLMAGGVLIYAALIDSMTYYAVHRHLAERSQGSLAGALGGICFAVADLLLVIPVVWRAPIPGAEGLLVTTYYAAQLAIAYGAATSRFAPSAVAERGKGDADGGAKRKLE